MTLRNPARERLAKGELSLGIGLRQARTVDIAAVMASCGYDLMAKYVALGIRMILSGNDLAMMMAGATGRAKFLREQR